MIKVTARVTKTSLGESLVGSHAYKPIRDSRREFLARKVSLTVLPKVSPSFGKTVGETFCSKQSRQESRPKSRIGLYAWPPARLRDSFFTRPALLLALFFCVVWNPTTFCMEVSRVPWKFSQSTCASTWQVAADTRTISMYENLWE